MELRGLEVFTQYCVRVLLVNRQGIEQMSACVYARTDQDGGSSNHIHDRKTIVLLTF